jgi:transmembrane 9 superfamily protein 2/4
MFRSAGIAWISASVFCFSLANAFYLPGAAPHNYAKGERVDLFVNALTPMLPGTDDAKLVRCIRPSTSNSSPHVSLPCVGAPCRRNPSSTVSDRNNRIELSAQSEPLPSQDDYYNPMLNFCKPKEGPKSQPESLGSILFGDRLFNSPYEVRIHLLQRKTHRRCPHAKTND